mgnify:CR=1 FL=1
MGACPNKDGLSTTTFPNNLSNTPVEVIETLTPIRFLEKEFLSDSAGAGTFRGGTGQLIRFEVISAEPLRLSAMFERTRFAPQGLRGGKPGPLFEITLEGQGPVPPKGTSMLPPGSILRIDVPGGGGHGPPTSRAPERVLADVRKELVSIEAARRDYKVVFHPNSLHIDQRATDRLRKDGPGI